MTPGSVLSERYRLLSLVGDGGMARVFRARDIRLQRVVALKTLHASYLTQPDFLRRFEQEAQLVASLAHPNIVAIYDVGHDAGTPYIVMEYVEGGALTDLIARAAPLPLEQVVSLTQQLGSALDAAHLQGVVHRDVKPANILLTPSGQIKVSDFGIARFLASPRQTATGMMLGSVAYIAPEQAQGLPTAPAADLYSAGIVLYEMLTGRTPFAADTPLATAMQHVTQQPLAPSQLVPTLPAAIDAVVLRALSKDPAQRFPSGAALAEAVTAAAVGAAAVTAIHIVPTVRLARSPRVLRGHRALAAPLLLVLLAGGLVYATSHVGRHTGSPRRSVTAARMASPSTTPTDMAVRGIQVAPSSTAVGVTVVATVGHVATRLSSVVKATVTPGSGTVRSTRPLVSGGSGHSSRRYAPRVNLRVSVSRGTAVAILPFTHVPLGARIAARWTWPNGTTTVWPLGRAYRTDPRYWASQTLTSSGSASVAALVNGVAVGVRHFMVRAVGATTTSTGGPPATPADTNAGYSNGTTSGSSSKKAPGNKGHHVKHPGSGADDQGDGHGKGKKGKG